ncbi:MAG TPA: hypothetical protein VH163_06035 [Gemmatimonadales bacterium]|nr:hypothetical protein [Gemmatimonadales bacterium]
MSATPSDAPTLQWEREGVVSDATGFIRPFRREDIPGVVTLRRHAFRLSEQETPSGLADYLDVVFFGSPWSDPAYPSWVYEDERGAVGGFVGVVPRPMVWRSRPIIAAVATQLMVAPGYKGHISVQLARAFFAGAQDLSIADCANDAAHRIWMAMEGMASPLRRMQWHVRLDRHGPRSHSSPGWGTYVSTLDPAELLPCMIDVLSGYRVAPSYDVRSLSWLLSMAAAKRNLGRLLGGIVRDSEGAAVGWVLYYIGARNRKAEILQMGSIPGARSLLLQHAMWQARSDGARELRGRVDPPFCSALATAQCEFTTTGPWVLLKARDPDLGADLEPDRDGRDSGDDRYIGDGQSDAFLSRLDGEWWLAF